MKSGRAADGERRGVLGVEGLSEREGRGTAGQENRLESAARHNEERRNKQQASPAAH